MAIIRQDGFCFFDLGNKQRSLILDNRIEDTLDYIKEKNITSLTIQPMLHDVVTDAVEKGFLISGISNLDFLARIPDLKELRLIDINPCNIDGIYSLKKLSSLTISNAKNDPKKNIRVDFSRMNALVELNIDWFDDGFDISRNEELETVSIRKYNSLNCDFTELRLPEKIKRLELIRSNIKCFHGLCSNTIEYLECSYLPMLGTLEGIEHASKCLKSLMIENAKRLNNYDGITKCLYIQDLVLVKCGDMHSLNCIRPLKKLNRVVLDKTIVTDGDIMPLMQVKKVAVTNKPHYNCKCVISTNTNKEWRYALVAEH